MAFPSSTTLRSGDIISVDIGTFYKGYAADMAYTFAVGEVPKRTKDLLTATEQSLYAGIAQMHVGRKMGDVSAAIQAVVEAAGFWVVREFVGHGIGTSFHESPEVPNYGRPAGGKVAHRFGASSRTDGDHEQNECRYSR